MATWRSDSYSGRYMELSITESVDVVNNKSTLYWTLSSVGGNVPYYTIGETTVTINGQQVYHKAQTDWSTGVFPAAVGSTSGSVTVTHDSDGSKSISVGFSTRVYVWQPLEYGGTMALTKIDRAAPSVSFGVSNITANSFKIAASTSVTASKWWYSLDGGTSWTEFGSEGTAKEVTVTGLAPNTSYNVQVCARKKSNQVDGYSEKASYKTLGGTIIDSVTTIIADSDTVNVTMMSTVYDSSYYHKLTIKNGTTVILTTDAVKFTSSGYARRTMSLTSDERTTLLNSMANVASFTATLELASYTNSACTTQVGNASTKTCNVTTRKSASGPSFTDFSYEDSRGFVSSLTGNDDDKAILIQSFSSLVVNVKGARAKNGARIVGYGCRIGDVSKGSRAAKIYAGTIDAYGDEVELKVYCTDSRGYTYSITKNVKILKYEKPKVYSAALRRKDAIEDIIHCEFSGSFSSIKPGDTELNSVKFAGYYYKKTTEDTWSDFCSVKDDVKTYGTSFNFSTEQLMMNATQALSLDPEYTYDVHLVVRDQLDTYTSYDDYFVVPNGKPIISMRKRNSTYDFARVGINNPNPEVALDVTGDIHTNGASVLAYTEAVNDATSSWSYRKYADGTCDLWARVDCGTFDITKERSDGWYGGTDKIVLEYPFDVDNAVINATYESANQIGGLPWIVYPGSTKKTPEFQITRAVAVEGSKGYLHIQVHGTYGGGE